MFSNPTYHVALVAGMLAAFNPCGFALLPAYLTLVVARGSVEDGTLAAVRRAVAMTLAMTGGFVLVFGAFGLVIVPLALSLETLPWVTVVVGVGLMVLGGWLLSGRELLLAVPRVAGAAPDRSLRSMMLYGVAYAVASLSCTVAPFLALTTTTFRSTGVLAGLIAFVAYGVGMGLVVGTLAVAVALGRHAVVRSARTVLPHLSRISGVLLILAGAYVTYYGIYELRLGADISTTDPVVDTVLDLQGTLARQLSGIGPGPVAIAFGALLAIGVGVAAVRRRSRATARPSNRESP